MPMLRAVPLTTLIAPSIEAARKARARRSPRAATVANREARRRARARTRAAKAVEEENKFKFKGVAFVRRPVHFRDKKLGAYP